MAGEVVKLQPKGAYWAGDDNWRVNGDKWEVDENGHLRMRCRDGLTKFIAYSAPAVISLKEDISGAHPPECEVRFTTPSDDVRTIVVSMETLFNPTKVGAALKELATCHHKELCLWFTDFFKDNGSRIPKTVTVATAGWTRDSHGRLAGIALPGRALGEVKFHCHKRVVAGKVDKYRAAPEGTLAEWMKTVAAPIADRPVFAAVMGAAVASVLLSKDPSAAPAFVVELAKSTKAGKTMLMRVVQSFFGRPGGHGGTSVERSWKMSRVALSEYLGACGGGLPVFFDDSAAEDESFSDGKGGGRYISPHYLAMNIANTGERITGSADGEGHESGVWSLIGLVTTEADMLGGAAGGATNRVVHLDYRPSTVIATGVPVDVAKEDDDAYIRKVVAAWSASASCYGHGLDPLYESLLDVDTSALVDANAKPFEAAFRELNFGNHYARMCGLIMAGVVTFNNLSEAEVGKRLLRERDVVTFLIAAVTRRLSSIGDIDPSERAWSDFITWAATVRGVYLWDGSQANPTKQRCLGKWKTRAATEALDGTAEGAVMDDIFISAPGLDAFCRETSQKLKPPALMNAWAAKGRLVAQKGGATVSEQFKTTIKGQNGVQLACYVISGKFWRTA